MSCLRSAHHGRRWLLSPGSRRRQAAGRGISTAADASASDSMRANSIPHGPSAQRGIALVLVLWLTVMLTVIAGSFAYGMRNEALAARNALSWAQARALADGAIHRTAFELLRPKVSPDVWAPDGSVRIWKDADDLRRPNGAEAADYKAAGLPYLPANSPFETVAELQRVLGMTPALYARLADNLTIHTRMSGINPLYASRAALLSMPGATSSVVDTYLAQRRDALAAKMPPPA